MNQLCSPLPAPHRLRETVIEGDTFVQRMRERGWSVASTRPIYTDPQVIRQPWLRCPNGACYSDRTFYHLFGISRFRKLLRAILTHVPCPQAILTSICPDVEERNTYLAFLSNQELLRKEGSTWQRGTRLFAITDIGHTLEAYTAEWFRLTQSRTHLIPVRHGVTLHRLLDLGDLDVVALLDPWTVTIECKSSTTVSDLELSLFLQRASLLRPAIAVLLLDTPSSTLDERIRRLNALLANQAVQNPETFDLLVPVPSAPGVYWGADHICVTGVRESLAISLTSVLHVIEAKGLCAS